MQVRCPCQQLAGRCPTPPLVPAPRRRWAARAQARGVFFSPGFDEGEPDRVEEGSATRGSASLKILGVDKKGTKNEAHFLVKKSRPENGHHFGSTLESDAASDSRAWFQICQGPLANSFVMRQRSRAKNVG